jgi:hypothetical protein
MDQPEIAIIEPPDDRSDRTPWERNRAKPITRPDPMPEPTLPGEVDGGNEAYRPVIFTFGTMYGSRYMAHLECGSNSYYMSPAADGTGIRPGYTSFSATRFGNSVMNDYGILGGHLGTYGGPCNDPRDRERAFDLPRDAYSDECAEITLHAGTEFEDEFSIRLPQLGAHNIRDLGVAVRRQFQAGETISLWKTDGERIRIAPADADELTIGRCGGR